MAWQLISDIPPGRYGNLWILPAAELGNQTSAELTWRVVTSPSDSPPGVSESPPSLKPNPTNEQHTTPVST